MQCAYSRDGVSTCQFEDQFDGSVIADGKWWCPFHAPIDHKDGYPTVKGNWREEKKRVVLFENLGTL